MEIVQAIILIFIAAVALAVVLTRDPLPQVMVFSFFGLLLGVMFIIFQAPAVAFSQISVGVVALPLMILIALARVRRKSK
jgi:uncharacterized MnhB-related membrane protein